MAYVDGLGEYGEYGEYEVSFLLPSFPPFLSYSRFPSFLLIPFLRHFIVRQHAMHTERDIVYRFCPSAVFPMSVLCLNERIYHHIFDGLEGSSFCFLTVSPLQDSKGNPSVGDKYTKGWKILSTLSQKRSRPT